MLTAPAPDDIGPAIDFWLRPRVLRPACRVCAGVAEGGPGPLDSAPLLQWEMAARQAQAWNLRAQRTGQAIRVLANSLEEFWEPGREFDHARRMALQVMSRTPHLAWMLLTADPGAILDLLHTTLDQVWSDASLSAREQEALADWLEAWLGGKPPANIWLGTVMGQAAGADARIQALLRVPAKVRFLSCNLGCPKVVAATSRQVPGTRTGRKVRRLAGYRATPTLARRRPGGWRQAVRVSQPAP